MCTISNSIICAIFRALKMALMLHQKGKNQMKKKKYKEALDVLIMAEVCYLLLPYSYLAYVIVMYSCYCKKPVQLLNCSAFYSTKFLYIDKFFLVLQEAFSLCDSKLIEVT